MVHGVKIARLMLYKVEFSSQAALQNQNYQWTGIVLGQNLQNQLNKEHTPGVVSSISSGLHGFRF